MQNSERDSASGHSDTIKTDNPRKSLKRLSLIGPSLSRNSSDYSENPLRRLSLIGPSLSRNSSDTGTQLEKQKLTGDLSTQSSIQDLQVNVTSSASCSAISTLPGTEDQQEKKTTSGKSSFGTGTQQEKVNNTTSRKLSFGKCTGLTETKSHKSAPCDGDWIQYRGKCYYISTEYDTWSNSERFCSSHDASLSIIDNKKELHFLFRIKGKENCWIGLRRTDDNKAWIWTNGTLYDGSLFQVKRALNESVDYVFLNSDDVRSEEIAKYKGICQKKKERIY
ncbi:killer cell lectin-like receptor subfamily F member 1 isoform X2 [Dendropsophus ebraccatus]|uniref:killer cell lectin-like receptor subfamily F member 1 isoform X2 n=1 Tax=Dendropsophus ebraccatus TaxID=150705 RepID=UPI0038320E27